MSSGDGGGERGGDAHVREAFSLLADETRLDIVAYLRDRESPAGYAEIMDGIGIRDSGRFNYHLDELRGRFVTETDEGYVLSFSANALYQTILSTRPLADHPELQLETDESCPECGTTYDICYETEMIATHCPECETQGFGYPFPPGGFDDRTDEQTLRAAVQRMYHHISLAQRGVCPYCSGVMSAAWTSDHDAPFDKPVLALYTCSLCDMTLHVSPAAAAQQHAVVVSLFDEYGLRPRELLPWEYREYVCSEEVAVRSDDPYRVTVPLEIQSDRHLLEVVERDRGVGVEIESR